MKNMLKLSEYVFVCSASVLIGSVAFVGMNPKAHLLLDDVLLQGAAIVVLTAAAVFIFFSGRWSNERILT